MKRKTLVFATVAAAALVFVSAAWALRFTDESYFTPVGTVGTPYSFTFTGAGGCGPALPYQYSLIGGLMPPGLTLASSGMDSTVGLWEVATGKNLATLTGHESPVADMTFSHDGNSQPNPRGTKRR